MSKEKKQDVSLLVVKHQREIALGRKHYAKADVLLAAICKERAPGEEIDLPSGKKAFVKDNFASANKVWRSHGIARFEIEVKDA